MKNLFSDKESYCVFISLNEEEINYRIQLLKEFQQVSIDWHLLNDVLTNAHNGTSMIALNSFDYSNWVKHYADYDIIINEVQVEKIWEYIMRYHQGIITLQSNGKFSLRSIPKGKDFRLEYVIMKTLELSRQL